MIVRANIKFYFVALAHKNQFYYLTLNDYSIPELNTRVR